MRPTPALLGLLLAAAACSSKPSTPASTTDALGCPTILPQANSSDTHCTSDGGTLAVPVLPLECADAGMNELEPDAGTGTFDDAVVAEGDDPECKYHVVLNWACSGSAREVRFRARVTRRSDGTPAQGGAPYMAAILGATHPAPNNDMTSPELEPGMYELGPVDFDRSGTWSMVLHIYELCPYGTAGSPHGEAAFDVDVP